MNKIPDFLEGTAYYTNECSEIISNINQLDGMSAVTKFASLYDPKFFNKKAYSNCIEKAMKDIKKICPNLAIKMESFIVNELKEECEEPYATILKGLK